MSTNTVINAARLPIADAVTPSDYFLIDDEIVTKRVNFTDVIFGLENVTFASTISSMSTDISTISSDVISLSAELYEESDSLTSLINSTVQAATGVLINLLYPVGSIKTTINNINPGTYIQNTAWVQVSQGLFLAGIGTSTDKNSTTLTVNPAADAANQAIGEVSHPLTIAELPAHTHGFTINLGIGSTSYQNGPQAQNWRLDNPTGYNTASVGSTQPHNNIPPFYGVYVWQRTA